MSAHTTKMNAGAPVSSATPAMSADEAMDIVSGLHQRAVAFIMAAEAAQGTKQDAHAVSTAERSQSHA